MSKKLDSILQTATHATSRNLTNADIHIEPQIIVEEKTVRLSIEIPFSIKRQLKQYVADRPSETEKTIVLKGLKILGFNIEDKYLYDLRSRKQNNYSK